jgi:hypothetical protein
VPLRITLGRFDLDHARARIGQMIYNVKYFAVGNNRRIRAEPGSS